LRDLKKNSKTPTLLTFSKQSQQKKKPSRLSAFVAKLIKTTQNRQNPTKAAKDQKNFVL
jgi:hypothetical protein